MKVSLRDAPLKSQVALRLDSGDDGINDRLAALGLRDGVVFAVQQKTASGGRVVKAEQSRIAIGAELSRKLQVEVFE
ncbi:MAG: ferrous iron transport protein A [Propionibacteriaceae bacterium]|nr:ferrous iron transport protein A [Propionibacteriaceae bacterium]